ncbi:unnamed protein product [Cunninghamella blakesleeana]
MDMSDSAVARHTQINAGAIPSSAEELAQKHQNLFQEYSRLKAQYTVLKKAVRKEKSDNALLQSSVKEKEKELRKLQGQLDVMAFHNERLSKRIEAVQKEDTKGTHFSLLGGNIKKELEKSTQALDAANLDLEKKIKENEELHDKISDVNFTYTKNIKDLYQQITKLEKQIEELQDERALIQSETQSQSSSLVKEKSDLENEINRLKGELALKSHLLEEDKQSANGDKESELELDYLRAILLSKVGYLESENKKITLNQVIPTFEALDDLNQQAKNYIYKLKDDSTVPQLPEELAKKLKLSNETWTDETNKLADEIESCQKQIDLLLEEKKNSDELLQNQTQKSTELESVIVQLKQQLETPSTDENELQTLKTKILELEQNISSLEATNNDLKLANESIKKENESLQTLEIKIEDILGQIKQKEDLLKQMESEQSILKSQVEEKSNEINHLQNQIESYQQQISDLEKNQYVNNNNNIKKEEEEEEEEDEEVFTYPVPKEYIEPTNQNNDNEEEEEEDEEVFTYPVPKEQIESTNQNNDVQQNKQINETNDTNSNIENGNKREITENNNSESTKSQSLQNGSNDKDHGRQDDINIEEMIRERENKLKDYYESQLKNLTEKLQNSDSKASRYSGMITTLREKMANHEEEKGSLQNEVNSLKNEIQTLKNEAIKFKEDRETSEARYQEKMSQLHEYITVLSAGNNNN